MGGLSWCDFRPHFDGAGVNAWCALEPLQGPAQTRELALAVLAEIVEWLKANAGVLGPGDRLQLIVGFHNSDNRHVGQIFKCWLPANRLPELQGIDFAAVGGAFCELEGWSCRVDWSKAKPV
jgi:hypothetical protein